MLYRPALVIGICGTYTVPPATEGSKVTNEQ